VNSPRALEWLALVSLASGALASPASAYCRTSTCTTCARDEATGCTVGGTPLAWPTACVSFSMNQAASASIDLDDATVMMREAFATWENARCDADGTPPALAISDVFGTAQCGVPQYNPHGGNANVVMFRDDSWPYADSGHELAATWISFDQSGVVYDADIEINATGRLSLTPPDAGVAYGVIVDQHDLLSIMVHEAGHFLGLDHSREVGSVMQAELAAAQSRTHLSPDDEAAICAAYPPVTATAACDYTPRGAYSARCATPPAGCSVAMTGSERHDAPLLAGSLLLGALLLLRKRASR
jgi:hypothetical protein